MFYRQILLLGEYNLKKNLGEMLELFQYLYLASEFHKAVISYQCKT